MEDMKSNCGWVGVASAITGMALFGFGVIFLRQRRRKTVVQFQGTLCYRQTSSVCRCLWLAEELGIHHAITVHHVTDECDDEMEADCLVLRNGTVMTDSVAICLYMAQAHNQLMPDRTDIAHYYHWSLYATTKLDDILRSLTEQIYRLPEEDRDLEFITSLTKQHGECMEAIDTHLEGRDYICKRFTTADVILGYSLFWSSMFRGGQLLINAPNVRAYLDRLKARKAFLKNMGGSRLWLMSMMQRS